MMSSDQPISPLDIAYHVLGLSERPLTPLEMAAFARRIGYEVSGREIKSEIDSHLLAYGYRSPFTEIGRERYGLYPTSNIGTKPLRHASVLLPAGVGLAITLILILGLFVGSLEGPEIVEENITVSLPVVNNTEPVTVQTSIQTIDPSWWFTNAINQINRETQEVARQYLSNYYNTCGPAVVAMMVSYYRIYTENGGERVTTADVLRAARNQLGYFIPPYNSGLLTFRHLRDLVNFFGLNQIYPEGDTSLLSLDEFLDRVRQGYPAIAGMRYHYNANDGRFLPSGGSGLYNHFVVVFSLEEVDGQEHLWVSNPHPGKYLYEDSDAVPVMMSIEQFSQSWALNDASEYANYGHAAFYLDPYQ